MTTDTYLTIEEAAAILRITRYHLRVLCRAGKIDRAAKIGGRGAWRIPRDSVVPAKDNGQ